MPAGRPPKPPKDKEIRGTQRKSRMRKTALIPSPGAQGVPRIPDRLDGVGRLAWLTLAPVLKQKGLLTPANAPALEELCDCWQRKEALKAAVARDGTSYRLPALNRVNGEVIKDEDGNPVLGKTVRNQDYVDMLGEIKLFVDLLAKFGLTPADAARATAAPVPDDNADPAADLLD